MYCKVGSAFLVVFLIFVGETKVELFFLVAKEELFIILVLFTLFCLLIFEG